MPRPPSPYAHGRSEIWGRSALERIILREQRKFGERVRSLREKAGLTQEQASERIGIHPKHLGRIEGGTVNVTMNMGGSWTILWEQGMGTGVDIGGTTKLDFGFNIDGNLGFMIKQTPIPAPAGVALMGAAGLLGARRRRA